jgi:hypothetical protein
MDSMSFFVRRSTTVDSIARTIPDLWGYLRRRGEQSIPSSTPSARSVPGRNADPAEPAEPAPEPPRERLTLPAVDANGDATTLEVGGDGGGFRIFVCAQTIWKFHPDFDDALVALLGMAAEVTQADRGRVMIVLVTSAEVVTGSAGASWQGQLVRRLRAQIAQSNSSDVGDRRGRRGRQKANKKANKKARIGEGTVEAKRVLFLAHLPTSILFQIYTMPQVAAVLDPFPFGGGMTALEAIGLGVPILTLPSRQTVPQLAAGMYRKMISSAQQSSNQQSSNQHESADTLRQLVPSSWAEYLALANRLAFDAAFRTEVSVAISASAHVLFDNRDSIIEWARLLENAAHQRG